MGGNSNMIVTIAVVVVVLGGLVAYYVIRGMKGNLTLTLNHRGVGSGDKFTGTLQVVCKRSYSIVGADSTVDAHALTGGP